MKVVLDTNVLVSGFLSPNGPPNRILHWVTSGDLVVVYDSRIIDEYREVLARPKFGFNPASTARFMTQLIAGGDPTVAMPLASRLRDPDDEMFLEVVLAGCVAHLITGNARHYPPSDRRGVSVVTPADFIRLYKP